MRRESYLKHIVDFDDSIGQLRLVCASYALQVVRVCGFDSGQPLIYKAVS